MHAAVAHALGARRGRRLLARRRARRRDGRRRRPRRARGDAALLRAGDSDAPLARERREPAAGRAAAALPKSARGGAHARGDERVLPRGRRVRPRLARVRGRQRGRRRGDRADADVALVRHDVAPAAAQRVGARARRRARVSVGGPRDGARGRSAAALPGGLSCSRGVGDRDAPHLLCEPDVFTGVLGEGDAALRDRRPRDAVTKTTARHLVVKSYDPCRVLGRLRDTTDDATVALLTDRPARARSRLDLPFFPRSPTTSTTSEATSDDDSAASPPRSAPDAEEAGCVVRARTRAPTAPSDA